MTKSSTTSSQNKNQNQINTKLQNTILDAIESQSLSHDQIVRLMGYHADSTNSKSQTKVVKRLQHVLSLLALGLSDSSYDFKYSSVEFIKALCKVLNLTKNDYLPRLNQFEQHAYQVLNAKTPTVYADITFNKNYKPSFTTVMAMSKFTNVILDDDIRLLEANKQLEAIQAIIKQHQVSMVGSIPFDGAINGYRVTLYGLDSASVKTDKQTLYIPASFD